jgi:hypothetical protein
LQLGLSGQVHSPWICVGPGNWPAPPAEDRLLEGVAAVGAGGGAAGLLHAREGGLHDGLWGQREGDVDAIAAVALHGGGEPAGPDLEVLHGAVDEIVDAALPAGPTGAAVGDAGAPQVRQGLAAELVGAGADRPRRPGDRHHDLVERVAEQLVELVELGVEVEAAQPGLVGVEVAVGGAGRPAAAAGGGLAGGHGISRRRGRRAGRGRRRGAIRRC